MKINKVKLHNFSSYEGNNEFDFEITDAGKNIVLIGGKNGAGKTSLFTAIKVALYGPLAYGYVGVNSHYISKIKDLINSKAFQQEVVESEVQLTLQLKIERDIRNYVIRPIFSQYAYQACNGDMAKVNEYTVQRKIYDNYIKHKYDTNKIEELSEKYVYHDEHISVGYNLEYILDLYCICKEKQDFSDGYKHYYVIGEDTDLNKFYNVAKQKEYILDIDLDFLNSENDFVKYRDIIINLIKGTDIITIAREHSYFNFLRDNIEWTNDIALQKILNLLEVI